MDLEGTATQEQIVPVTNAGKWSQEQHENFLKGLKEHGLKWMKISRMVRTRSCSQVRSHHQKYLNKQKNDQEKIGNQKNLKLRNENDHAQTRAASLKNKKEAEKLNPEGKQPEKTQMDQVNPKKEKYLAGNKNSSKSQVENSPKKSKASKNDKTAKKMANNRQIQENQSLNNDLTQKKFRNKPRNNKKQVRESQSRKNSTESSRFEVEDFSRAKNISQKPTGQEEKKQDIQNSLTLSLEPKEEMLDETVEEKDVSYFTKIFSSSKMSYASILQFVEMTFKVDKIYKEIDEKTMINEMVPRSFSFTPIKGKGKKSSSQNLA